MVGEGVPEDRSVVAAAGVVVGDHLGVELAGGGHVAPDVGRRDHEIGEE